MTTEEYCNRMQSIELTNGQWITLLCYILSTTQHRKGEKEAWMKLSKETDDDGNPLFPAAPKQVEYYEDLEVELTTIAEAINRGVM